MRILPCARNSGNAAAQPLRGRQPLAHDPAEDVSKRLRRASALAQVIGMAMQLNHLLGIRQRPLSGTDD
jgi:hypothetical protein